MGPPSWPAVLVAAALGFSLVVVFGNTNPSPTPTTEITAPPLAASDVTTTAPPSRVAPLRVVGFPTKPPGWVELDPGPLVSRMGHTVAWTGEAMLVWGGRSMLHEYRGGGSYRPDAGDAPSWTFLAPAPIGGPAGATAWTGTAMFVTASGAAWYEASSDRWTAVNDHRLDTVVPVAASWTGDQLLVLPEARATNEPGPLYGLDAPPAPTCCRSLATPPFAADHGSMHHIGDDVVFIGGHTARQGEPPTFASYRPSSDSWTLLESPPLTSTAGLTATWTGDTLIAIDTALETAAWTPASGWQPLASLPFDAIGCYPRSIAFAGSTFVWHCRNAAWLDLDSRTWIDIATPDLPSHTVSTTCEPLATESSILLWCGNGDGGPPLLFEALTVGPAGEHGDPDL